ncbi:DNA damage-inducible protein DinB [Luteitalea sp. TBR-22]|uniref:DinB family protein n=1 Tax=Luteitalea sp. TBR-22 TaxID=2802971 RepID=UPI001AF182F3|nr:DinB family protein [Luteitalea sp. TBR-22]BCS32887.1 DNA damage-inducible protein DinB [Luteitalea sp. TBR-22]
MLAMRPQADEYGAFYAGYVARVPDGAWLERLYRQPGELEARLAGVADEQAALPLAPGKWSLLDMITHLSDTERVFAFRLLWFARGDAAELPGFDQDAWARESGASRRTVAQALDEFAAVRRATIALVEGLPEQAASRRGIANGHPISVRALAWIIAGHVQHHLEHLAI